MQKKHRRVGLKRGFGKWFETHLTLPSSAMKGAYGAAGIFGKGIGGGGRMIGCGISGEEKKEGGRPGVRFGTDKQ